MNLGSILGRMAGLTFVHSMTLFGILLTLFFLGRVFGAPKLLVGFVSLFGQRLGIRFLLMTIFQAGLLLRELVLHVLLC